MFMKRYLKKNAVSIVSGVLALVAMWLVWLIAEKTVSNEYVIPSFAQTLEALKQVLGRAFFWRALLKTLLKTVYAFLISFSWQGYALR